MAVLTECFQNDVGIGAAQAEGTDPGDPSAPARPAKALAVVGMVSPRESNGM